MIKNRLKERRLSLKLSQEYVAFKSGISFVTYSSVENRKRIPRLETALKIAKTLKTSVNKLFALNYDKFRK